MSTEIGRRALDVLLILAAAAPAAVGQDWVEEAKLTASDAAPRDWLGQVALDGDRALVAAFGAFGGSAYIFELSGGRWSEVAKLTAGDNERGDEFGTDVALDGNRALVGAAFDTHVAQRAGSVYVFEFSGGRWREVAKLTATDAGACFGCRVALDGDRALIGAPKAGLAYIFELSGDRWIEVAKLTAGDVGSNGRLGRSVALDGDRALVAARAGSAYIFERSGGRWSEADKLTAGDAEEGSWLGDLVALDGNRALVGAFGGAGSAYIFELSDGRWSEVAKLTATDAAAGDWFGFSVALDGNQALVGAIRDDHAGGGNAGSAYIFEFSGGRWSEAAKLTAADAERGDNFGNFVALDGDRALIGAWLDDHDGREDAGAAYIFSREAGNVPQFRRGDANTDGDLNLTDAVFILGALFLGGTAPTCTDAADADDSGSINLTDAVLVLNHLFAGGPALSEPFETCGVDPTADVLDCAAFTGCL